MIKDFDNMQLVCEKWAPIAQEYAKFLNRYSMQTVCVISGETFLGYTMKVFADEEKYLDLSFNNKQFCLEEKQINELLGVIENLSVAAFYEKEDELSSQDEPTEFVEDEEDLYF